MIRIQVPLLLSQDPSDGVWYCATKKRYKVPWGGSEVHFYGASKDSDVAIELLRELYAVHHRYNLTLMQALCKSVAEFSLTHQLKFTGRPCPAVGNEDKKLHPPAKEPVGA